MTSVCKFESDWCQAEDSSKRYRSYLGLRRYLCHDYVAFFQTPELWGRPIRRFSVVYATTPRTRNEQTTYQVASEVSCHRNKMRPISRWCLESKTVSHRVSQRVSQGMSQTVSRWLKGYCHGSVGSLSQLLWTFKSADVVHKVVAFHKILFAEILYPLYRSLIPFEDNTNGSFYFPASR